jgi:hypothetical protein
LTFQKDGILSCLPYNKKEKPWKILPTFFSILKLEVEQTCNFQNLSVVNQDLARSWQKFKQVGTKGEIGTT